MTPRTQRVVERFIYEGLLLHNTLHGRKWRVTLRECWLAGQEEPRILELLPGILLHRPRLLWKVARDFPRYPELQQLCNTLFTAEGPATWASIPKAAFVRQANRMQQSWQHRRQHTKWRNQSWSRLFGQAVMFPK